VSAAAVLTSLSGLTRWQYRTGQFFRGFRTAVDPEDARTIVGLLSPAELDLFLSMRPRDRRHAVETMRHADRIAREHGSEASSDLRVAGLLHDVGKGPLHVHDRVLYVILRAASPSLVDHFARSEGARWRVALWRLRHHASFGAAQLQAVGSAPRVVELTAVHHLDDLPRDDLELSWLLEADEAA
jgi:putative nucleotidyltransferase with HDIG domain